MGCHDHANLSSWAYARSTGFGMAQLESLIFINLPVACLALILGYVFLPKEQGDNKQEFDWAGFFFSVQA